MAFCPNCGNQQNPDALICSNCGGAMTPEAASAGSAQPPIETPPPPSAPPPAGPGMMPPPYPGPGMMPPPYPGPGTLPAVQARSTSGLAVASLILSLCGFVCLPVLGPILGIIFGIMAKSQIRRESGRLQGSGMATAGIVIGVIAIVLILAVALPVGIWVYNTVKGPMDTTNDFIAFVKDGNVDAAYDLLAPGTVTKSIFKDFVAANKGTPDEYFAFSSSIENDYAEVTVRFTYRDGGEYEGVFDLRKQNGDWLITYAPDW